MDSSIFHGSVPTPTVDNLLYPSHSTFLQDIINTGLLFLCLLGILWTLVLSTGIRVFFQTRILWNMAWSWCWGSIPIQIFFGTVLFWDTCLAIGSILNATSLSWSRVHRRYPHKRHSLKSFPRSWMILSAIMINWSHGAHPASLVLDTLQCTSSRICRLSALVSLTPAVWCQFSAFKGHELLEVFHQPVCADTDEKHVSPLPELGGDVAPDGSSEDHYFFDSLESPPELSFFDSFANLSTMSRSQDSIDFLDCFPRPTGCVILTDWMDISLFYDHYCSLCLGR